MLGVLLWLTTEHKRDPDSARNFANHWASWMENHLSQNEFSLCRWDWTDGEAMDSCALEGTIFGARAAIIRRVFDHIGANAPERRERIGGVIPTWRSYRLGDGRDAHDYLSYLSAACALAPDRGSKFNCHLLSVASLIFQEIGDDQRITLDEGFQKNPFALWVNNGRRTNDEIQQLAYDRCLEATLSHEAGTNVHNQWMWERSDFERDDRDRRVSYNSFGWDCIAMINLLLNRSLNRSIKVDEVIGRGGWVGSIAVANGFVYLADAEGNLRRGAISSAVRTEVIGEGGWTGSIAVADGFVYMAAPDGNLLRGRLTP